MVGAIYSIIPSIESGNLLAADANINKGMIVITPAPIRNKLVVRLPFRNAPVPVLSEYIRKTTAGMTKMLVSRVIPKNEPRGRVS